MNAVYGGSIRSEKVRRCSASRAIAAIGDRNRCEKLRLNRRKVRTDKLNGVGGNKHHRIGPLVPVQYVRAEVEETVTINGNIIIIGRVRGSHCGKTNRTP